MGSYWASSVDNVALYDNSTAREKAVISFGFSCWAGADAPPDTPDKSFTVSSAKVYISDIAQLGRNIASHGCTVLSMRGQYASQRAHINADSFCLRCCKVV